jgi:chitodextrinase
MITKTTSTKEEYYMHTYIRHIAMILLMCLFATSAHAAQISVEPVYQEVFQGENVTIDIIVDPQGSSVYSASYTLYFNNTFLNATSQMQGSFLSQDGESTMVYVDEINNTLGKIEYAEGRVGTDVGVNDSGVLTTITFQAIGVEEISLLNITDLSGGLLESTSGPIPTNTNNGSVKINETPKFVISGFVEYDNGDPVLDPSVAITNLNTSEVFVAETNASSNHYHASIIFTHISSNDVLRFNASDDLGNVTMFDHTVTQDETNAGGFEQNITLYIPDTTPPVITNITVAAVMKDSAIITWETDEVSDSLVKYGTEPRNYTKTAYNTIDMLNHSIDLAGLTLNTTYYYVVNSTDPSDNSAESMEFNFTTFDEVTIEIGDAGALPGENVTTQIMIRNAPNVGTVDIILGYNQSVVHVIKVADSSFDYMDAAIDNSSGIVRFIAFQITSPGLSGDVKIANVTLVAVGSGGETSALDINIIELKDAGSEEISIPAVAHNGTFAVWETIPPVVVGPSANPPSIPEDTDFYPGWGETSQLNVTVTDESDIERVTVNLSSIGGLSDQPMTRIAGTDTWTVTVNASVGSAVYNGSYLSHNLTVYAVDALGNVNMSIAIPLTIILNGDVSENGEVTVYDAMYIAKHILNRPGFEIMNDGIGEVSGNGVVTSYDAMYLAKHIATELGFELLR